MALKKKKVCVTGGAGFIGSYLVDRLVSEGCEVTVIDNLQGGNLNNLAKSQPAIHFNKSDVRDYDSLKNTMKGIDLVFHLAANANVPYSVECPEYDFETNIIGTYNILRSCLHNSIGKLVYASSAAIYGNPKYVPMDENHPLDPVSPYGASKLAGEKLAFAYSHVYNLQVVSMRISNTYGPRQPRYVMYDLFNKLKANPHQMEVLGTGEQLRDYCYIEDTINAFILAAEHDKAIGGAFNIASGKATSIKEVVTIILKALNLENTTKVTYTGQSWKGDIDKLLADNHKLSSLGFKPEIDLYEGIIRMREWLQEMYKQNDQVK